MARWARGGGMAWHLGLMALLLAVALLAGAHAGAADCRQDADRSLHGHAAQQLGDHGAGCDGHAAKQHCAGGTHSCCVLAAEPAIPLPAPPPAARWLATSSDGPSRRVPPPLRPPSGIA